MAAAVVLGGSAARAACRPLSPTARAPREGSSASRAASASREGSRGPGAAVALAVVALAVAFTVPTVGGVELEVEFVVLLAVELVVAASMAEAFVGAAGCMSDTVALTEEKRERSSPSDTRVALSSRATVACGCTARRQGGVWAGEARAQCQDGSPRAHVSGVDQLNHLVLQHSGCPGSGPGGHERNLSCPPHPPATPT